MGGLSAAAGELNTTALNSLREENISQFLPEFLLQLQREHAASRGTDKNSIELPLSTDRLLLPLGRKFERENILKKSEQGGRKHKWLHNKI